MNLQAIYSSSNGRSRARWHHLPSIDFLSMYTHHDLAFAVSKLFQYLSDPSVIHTQAAKHVPRYIKGTLDYGISYSAPEDERVSFLIGFSDASHAADRGDRKSHSGLIFFHFSGPIVWESRKQSVTALSSMESEYRELSDAAKEAIFLQKLASSIGIKLDLPAMIYTDSASALGHVKNNVQHTRTKHIDTRFHYSRSIFR